MLYGGDPVHMYDMKRNVSVAHVKNNHFYHFRDSGIIVGAHFK